jgi:HAS barrel domain
MRLPLLGARSNALPKSHPDHIAEVVETETSGFLAQCLDPETLEFAVMPPFGSWVWAEEPESKVRIYGVVYQVSTRPTDSVHRTRALGLSLEELQTEQPQIFAMLKTEFQVAIVGFQSPGSQGAAPVMRQYLPPRPPPVHQGVHRCNAEEIIAFSDRLDFLPTLLRLNAAPVDDLIAAILREGYQLRRADRHWLVEAGRALAVFLREDYDRLRLILNQVHV